VISVEIEPLSLHLDLLPIVTRWFEEEWPTYYGKGGGASAAADALSYSRSAGLPRGFVAISAGRPCGFAALKSERFPSHPHLGPWVGAAYVSPPLRRHGIGRALLKAVEAEACAQGHSHVYCATGTSASLLQRAGWRLLEQVEHEGQNVGVYEKAV
jgi:GNAT superfamily N-acetyltransferase